MAEEIVIADLDINIDGLIQKAQETTTRIAELREAQKSLRKEGQEGSKQFVQNAAELANLRNLNRSLTKTIAASSNPLKDQAQRTQLLNNALEAEIDNIEDLRAQNAILNRLRNTASLRTAEGAEEIAKLNAALDKNNALIKGNVSEREQDILSVGGYTKAIKDAASETGLFNGTISQTVNVVSNFAPVFNSLNQEFKTIINNFTNLSKTTNQTTNNFTQYNEAAREAGDATGGVSDAAGKATTAQKALTVATNFTTNSFKLLKLALASTGIIAIVIALGSLVSFLTQTSSGAATVTDVMTQLGNVISVVVNRLSRLGSGIVDILTLNFSEGIDKIATSFDGLAQDISQANRAALNFNRLVRQNTLANRDSERVLANLSIQQAKYQAVLDDSTNSFAVLEKANRDLLNTEIQIAEERTAIARRSSNEIVAQLTQIAKTQGVSFSDLLKETDGQNQELIKSYFDAVGEIAEAKANEISVLSRANKESNQINQDRVEIDLDILIDGFDNVKTINERIIDNDKKTLQERQSLLNQTIDLARESFDQQIALIQAQTSAEVNANDLLNESNAVVLAERIKNLGLSEQLSTRLLEIIRERRLAEQDFADSQSKINEDQAANDAKAIENKQKLNDLELDLERQKNEALDQLNLSRELREAKTDEERDLIRLKSRREQGEREIEEELRIAREKEDAIREQQLAFDLANATTDEERDNIRRVFEADSFERDVEFENVKQARLLALNENFIAESSELERQAKLAEEIADIENNQKAFNRKLEFARNLVNISNQLFGETKAGAIASIAIERAAAISEIISNTGIANAKAVAASPLTAGQPFVTVNTLLGAASIAGSIKSGLQAVGEINSVKKPTPKFRSGGNIMINGKSHEQGGVPIYAGSQLVGEAEGGEIIGIFNKSASRSIMDYNSQFLNGSELSKPNFFQAGGTVNIPSPTFNPQQIRRLVRAEISQTRFVVPVPDINDVNADIVATAEDGTI